LEGKEEYFDDGFLLRLWPPQEVILSDEVQFVRCEAAYYRPTAKAFPEDY
jgi:hypothetical protein